MALLLVCDGAAPASSAYCGSQSDSLPSIVVYILYKYMHDVAYAMSTLELKYKSIEKWNFYFLFVNLLRASLLSVLS